MAENDLNSGSEGPEAARYPVTAEEIQCPFIERERELLRAEVIWRIRQSPSSTTYPADLPNRIVGLMIEDRLPAYLLAEVERRRKEWCRRAIDLANQIELGLENAPETKQLAQWLFYSEDLKVCAILVGFPECDEIGDQVRRAIEALAKHSRALARSEIEALDWQRVEQGLRAAAAVFEGDGEPGVVDTLQDSCLSQTLTPTCIAILHVVEPATAGAGRSVVDYAQRLKKRGFRSPTSGAHPSSVTVGRLLRNDPWLRERVRKSGPAKNAPWVRNELGDQDAARLPIPQGDAEG